MLWLFGCMYACSIVTINMTFELAEKMIGAGGSMRAATNIHKQLWNAVCTAPMWFYDHNPVGRILNRFSTDISIIDLGILRRIGYSFTAAVSCALSVSKINLKMQKDKRSSASKNQHLQPLSSRNRNTPFQAIV